MRLHLAEAQTQLRAQSGARPLPGRLPRLPRVRLAHDLSARAFAQDKLQFASLFRDLHEYLSEAPFIQYQDSMYFDRFLQWKMLERSERVFVCV